MLPAGAVRVAVEAGVRQGWDRWLLGERGKAAKAAFVGMDSFGASAPAGDLYAHFGITAENVYGGDYGIYARSAGPNMNVTATGTVIGGNGISAGTEPHSRAYLSAKGIRDIASGLFQRDAV